MHVHVPRTYTYVRTYLCIELSSNLLIITQCLPKALVYLQSAMSIILIIKSQCWYDTL